MNSKSIRYEELTPEQRARVDAARAAARTPEARAEEERIRALYSDHPSWAELERRGDVVSNGDCPPLAFAALLRALASLKAARLGAGLTLDDISRRSGLAIAQISRLESGRNPNPTFETLARYADALGMTLGVSLTPGHPAPSPEVLGTRARP